MFKTLKTLAIVAGSATLLFVSQDLSAHDYSVGDIVIDHPWSRATAAGARVGAGYLVLRNTGETADRLVAGDTDISTRVEIHEMSMTDGVMKMREIADGLEIPAGGEVALEPGGYHIMFMDLIDGLVEGEMFTAELTFEKAGTIDVEFHIEGIGARSPSGDDMDHGDMDHGNHGDSQ